MLNKKKPMASLIFFSWNPSEGVTLYISQCKQHHIPKTPSQQMDYLISVFDKLLDKQSVIFAR